MSMFFGDETHSRGDPRYCTLEFYTKVQVWGRVVKIIHTKGHLGLKRIDSSTLLLKRLLKNE
jgi:hypothetical protein